MIYSETTSQPRVPTVTGVFYIGRAVVQVVAFRWACGQLLLCGFLFCPRVSRVVFIVFVCSCLSLFVAVFVYCFL